MQWFVPTLIAYTFSYDVISSRSTGSFSLMQSLVTLSRGESGRFIHECEPFLAVRVQIAVLQAYVWLKHGLHCHSAQY